MGRRFKRIDYSLFQLRDVLKAGKWRYVWQGRLAKPEGKAGHGFPGTDMDIFGAVILKAMKEKGLNLTQLAKKAGMDKRNVQKIKVKKYWAPQDMVTFGEALGVDLFDELRSEATKAQAAAEAGAAAARETELRNRVAELEKERDGLKREIEMLNLRIEVMREKL